MKRPFLPAPAQTAVARIFDTAAYSIIDGNNQKPQLIKRVGLDGFTRFCHDIPNMRPKDNGVMFSVDLPPNAPVYADTNVDFVRVSGYEVDMRKMRYGGAFFGRSTSIALARVESFRSDDRVDQIHFHLLLVSSRKRTYTTSEYVHWTMMATHLGAEALKNFFGR